MKMFFYLTVHKGRLSVNEYTERIYLYYTMLCRRRRGGPSIIIIITENEPFVNAQEQRSSIQFECLTQSSTMRILEIDSFKPSKRMKNIIYEN